MLFTSSGAGFSPVGQPSAMVSFEFVNEFSAIPGARDTSTHRHHNFRVSRSHEDVQFA